ncbi:hypothetical protein E2C01_083860 [Portunus trituberculatus]|uniref:Uncharacterized protein n=1 Tax=Portunus trituberculatus TaxID=210409 RepID=A0A5B7J2F6_PORTR|nr:hypothetical protein [Portunus trituberculatus]
MTRSIKGKLRQAFQRQSCAGDEPAQRKRKMGCRGRKVLRVADRERMSKIEEMTKGEKKHGGGSEGKETRR